MPQHVGMHLEQQLGLLASALDHPVKAIGGEWPAPFTGEHESPGRSLVELPKLRAR